MKFLLKLIQGGLTITNSVELSDEAVDNNALINKVCDSVAWDIARRTVRAKKAGFDRLKSNKPIQFQATVGDTVIIDTQKLAVERGITSEVKFSTLESKAGIVKFSRKMKAVCHEFVSAFRIVDFNDEIDVAYESIMQDVEVSSN